MLSRSSDAASEPAPPPRVLMVHNAYRLPGGEDRVVDAETALLRSRGHSVLEWRRDNREIAGIGRVRLAAQTVWSMTTRRDTLRAIRRFRPDVVHIHNSFPLLSPSLHWACSAAGVPVVQTLHNFRLACPQAMLLRDGQVCESCLGRTPWPAVVHACYRGSRAQTAVVVAMTALHRALGTYDTKVARYIALNEFCRAKFIEAGLPASRIAVKPNFTAVPCPPAGSEVPRRGLLYVGRLAQEKGIAVLAAAWRAGVRPDASLRIAGIGPCAWPAGSGQGVELLGACSPPQVATEMAAAVALVMPSLWYENFPVTLVEAFAAGLPVIASRIGALAELIEDGRTGLLVEPGDARALADAMRWALDHPGRMAAMGSAARERYLSRYTPDINYRQLMAIYRSAIAMTGSPAALALSPLTPA